LLIPVSYADTGAVTTNLPSSWGLRMVRSKHLPAGWSPMLVDTRFLGGKLHEMLFTGNYSQVSGTTVESKTWRPEETDGVWLQARKADVPFVRNPLAGIRVDGTGL
jgi:hypothetical protein